MLAGEDARQAGRGGQGDAESAQSTSQAPASPAATERTEDEHHVLATLARLTHSRAELLDASDRLVELGVDSLTKVELLSEIETQFGLVVDDETSAGLRSVQDLLDLARVRAVA